MSDVIEKYYCYVHSKKRKQQQQKKNRWAFYPDGRFPPRYPTYKNRG